MNKNKIIGWVMAAVGLSAFIALLIIKFGFAHTMIAIGGSLIKTCYIYLVVTLINSNDE